MAAPSWQSVWTAVRLGCCPAGAAGGGGLARQLGGRAPARLAVSGGCARSFELALASGRSLLAAECWASLLGVIQR